MAWNPDHYLAFGDHRLRPAVDLLDKVALAAPAAIDDLGCGAGNVTRLLAQRWPGAAITAIDNSPDMLARARQEQLDVAWIEADIAAYAPERSADLVFSNAALQWLGDHRRLFPHLLTTMAPGGVLAVQMPRNHATPSQTLIGDVARAGPWREKLAPVLPRVAASEPAFYYELLARMAARLDIWETEYLHVLDGDDPVVAWTSSTSLRPVLDALAAGEREAFLAEYTARVRDAYPPRPNGQTLFGFRRLFIVATR